MESLFGITGSKVLLTGASGFIDKKMPFAPFPMT